MFRDYIDRIFDLFHIGHIQSRNVLNLAMIFM